MSSRNFRATAELAAELGDPDVGVIDASWHLPLTERVGWAEFRRAHIPGAVFFDIDKIADIDSGLPHMLPTPDALAKAMSGLGLGDGMRLVVYDALGLFAAARVWWTLRAYGVEDVRILEGGLPKWIKEGRPLESGDARPTPRVFTPRLDGSFVATLDEVREALATGEAQVVDARPADRFRGAAPEPRPGLKSGHMPGSLNLPFVEIVEHGLLKPPEALKAAFAEHKVDLEKPIITSCGSGVTAAILALAVEEAEAGCKAFTTAPGRMGFARRLRRHHRSGMSGPAAASRIAQALEKTESPATKRRDWRIGALRRAASCLLSPEEFAS